MQKRFFKGAFPIAVILQYPLALVLILALHFVLIHMMPGDPLVHLLGEEGYYRLSTENPGELDKIRDKYGLNGATSEKFIIHLSGVLKGDLGFSYHYGMPVTRVILGKMKWTLVLLLPSVLISSFLGGWLGAVSGWTPRGTIARVLTPLFMFIYSIPGYCLGFLLLIAAFHTDFMPLGGVATSFQLDIREVIGHMMLPMVVIVLHSTAFKFIIMKNAVLQEAGEGYVLTAISKGLDGSEIMLGHVMKNALPPFVTVVAMNLGFIVGGSLVVEMIFSWQGMGMLIYDAVFSRDYPLLSGSFLIICICVILANALADILCRLLDPRVGDDHGKF